MTGLVSPVVKHSMGGIATAKTQRLGARRLKTAGPVTTPPQSCAGSNAPHTS